MHSLDFEYISALKGKLSNPGKGKGCVNISYDNAFDKDILQQLRKSLKGKTED